LERFYDGTGVPILNRNIIHKENIIEVPIPRQTAFSSFAQQAEQLRLTVQQSLSKLEALKRPGCRNISADPGQEKITVKKSAYSPLFESNYARDTQ
jgi:hypothetical protein